MQTKSILAIAAYISVVFALVQTEQTGKQLDSAFIQKSVDISYRPNIGGGDRNANGESNNSGNYNSNKGCGSNGNIGNAGSVH
ncbi:hypothetical protein BDN71DRAFT_1444105 [Pleurotus eryngii]|uniref:Uncharacterized protein n=1 Tax=Pleurotus eryngii TaxID=5323 RepID=A0A9P6A5A3_PLEER|nr:hypothetical protein BDN71DRAFT_1444105 [Pleurotus eryngii]